MAPAKPGSIFGFVFLCFVIYWRFKLGMLYASRTHYDHIF